MRTLAFALVLLGTVCGLASGCGGRGSSTDGSAGNATAGSDSSSSAGKAGGTATAGSASDGSPSGGSASDGSPSGGSATDGSPSGGSASDGSSTGGRQPDPQGGAGNDGEGGRATGLLDCDARKAMCKRIAPVCDAGEVPTIDGICYGRCVKIEQCACSAPEQCPIPEQYTCWGQEHCGPFVQ